MKRLIIIYFFLTLSSFLWADKLHPQIQELLQWVDKEDLEQIALVLERIPSDSVAYWSNENQYFYYLYRAFIGDEYEVYTNIESDYLKAKSLRESLGKVHHIEYALILHGLAREMERNGRIQDAISYIEEALVRCFELYFSHEYDEQFSYIIGDLASYYKQEGLHAQVAPLYREAHWCLSQSADSCSSESYAYLYLLSSYLNEMENYAEAINVQNEVVSLLEKNKCQGCPDYPEMLQALALFKIKNKEYESAAQIEERIAQIWIQLEGGQSENLMLVYNRLFQLYSILNNQSQLRILDPVLRSYFPPEKYHELFKKSGVVKESLR